MDAPATASVMFVAPYNGYFGCRKCCTKSEYYGKVVFPEMRAPLRTNDDFRQRTCSSHHTGTSILERLNMDMVQDIPLDPMHLLYLGVVKKMLKQWMERKKGSDAKLSLAEIEMLNKKIATINPFYPREFQRKPRKIEHFKIWKATEFRDFLLYTGPLLLKDVLAPSAYKHFMALSTAARILSSNQYSEHNDAANDLLVYVVKHFKTLYGINNVTYIVHSLLHLANDCLKFGKLEEFSAFNSKVTWGK